MLTPDDITRASEIYAKLKKYYAHPEHGFYRFLKECTFTTDEEAKPELGEQVVKRFPSEKGYIKYLVRHVLTNRLVIIPKSRRMMATWLLAAYCLWFALVNERRVVLWQAQSGKKSADTLEKKMLFILTHIPFDRFAPFVDSNSSDSAIPAGFTEGLVNYYKPKRDQQGLVGITFMERTSDPNDLKHKYEAGSSIYGVPEGADQWRQYTVSLGVCDEFAFFNKPGDSVKGARPTIGLKGQLVLISSANPGYMAEMIKPPDLEVGQHTAPQPTPEFPGIRSWKSKTGYLVSRVHYTADDEKRGVEWTGEIDPRDPKSGLAREGYDLKQWKQEMEIDFSVHQGEPFYPRFSESIHVKPLQPLEGEPLLLGFDFGLTPSTVICQLHKAGFLLVLDELTSEGSGITQHLEPLSYLLNSRYHWWRGGKALDPELAKGRRMQNTFSLIDPAGNQRAQTDMSTPMLILQQYGYNPRPSVQDPAQRMESVDYFLRTLKRHPTRGEMYPAILIDPGCRMLIEGLRGGAKQSRFGKFQKEKNEFSHIVEALEYVTVSLMGGVGQGERDRRKTIGAKPFVQHQLR